MGTPFHLAFPVKDIESTRAFFGDLLGCEIGRSTDKWIDFNFFGHQLSAHVKPEELSQAHANQVDGDTCEEGNDSNRNKGNDNRSRRDSEKKESQEQPAAAKPAPSGDRESGTVKWFNRTKGFGFIVRESGEEIFVHQRSILSEGSGDNRRRPALKDGQNVTFVVANREKGLQAEDVSPA